MKKTILLIAIFISAVAMCYTSLAQNPPKDPPTETLSNLITFYEKIFTGTPRPRSVIFVPVTGTYDYSAQCVRLNFLDNIGEVTVTVINHSTGEQSIEYVDSAFESAEIYVSGDEGRYSIIIETQQGGSYCAEFVL